MQVANLKNKKHLIDSAFYVLSGCYLLAIFYLSFIVPRENFWLSYGLMCASFLTFIGIYKCTNKFTYLFIVGLLARIILLFSTPELSDDFYRFLWDGAVTNSGHNPFLYKPTEVLVNGWLSQEFLDKFNLLNSPEYYTVYPPFIQLVDFLSVVVGRSFSGSLFVMKLFFLLGELLSVFFLTKLLRDSGKQKHIYLYWVCPFIVLEFLGNLHFEAFMIAFLLGSFWFFKKEKWLLSALFFVLACYTKLIPLAFFPFYFMACKSKIKFTSYTFFFLLVGFIPIGLDAGYLKIFESVKLYFGSFEFNSGVAYFGQKYKYSHPYLGLTLKAVSFLLLSTWFLYFFIKKVNFMTGIAVFYLVYVLFSQSVHPWYILPLLPLFLVKLRFPYTLWVWFVLIGLSYITYQTADYEQKIWVRILEYGVLYMFGLVELFFYCKVKKI